jgi:hypothetical protein
MLLKAQRAQIGIADGLVGFRVEDILSDLEGALKVVKKNKTLPSPVQTPIPCCLERWRGKTAMRQGV